MSRVAFGDEERAAFARAGFAVVRGLFDAEETKRIATWIEELEALPEIPGRTMKYFEEDASAPGRRILNRMENFAPHHEGLADLLTGERMQGLAAALLGEPAVLFKDKVNFKKPGAGGFEAHQDVQAGWDDYASLFVTASIAVDRATPENGCLELAHWRHRRERIGELWTPLTDAQLEGVAFVAYPAEPGDALFFDSYLPHRSGPNGTDAARRVLYVTYNRESEGDQRVRYYTDKRRSFPPDCERQPGREYRYRV
jgi:ectoine hydroxylase-related dioxygenase (phytanoyl-CoA dioxygenase family)